MTDGWDERTEAIPGTRGNRAFELDLELPAALDGHAQPRGGQLGGDVHEPPLDSCTQRLRLIVFEPAHIGLAAALERVGYSVASGATGVDVMALVAAGAPGAVLCAPSPDAERRRLLAAALRLRFPHVPVIYVSTHARHEEAVLGAVREGARAVIPWPLPAAVDVERLLAPWVRQPGQSTELVARAPAPLPAAAGPARAKGVQAFPLARGEERIDPELPTAPLGVPSPYAPGSGAAGFTLPETLIDVERPALPNRAAPIVELPADALRPLPVPLPVAPLRSPPATASPVPLASSRSEHEHPGDEFEPLTEPGIPAPLAAVQALAERRGEIGALLAAVSPFLWSLEDAARWADTLAAAGDATAAGHARTMHLLARILAQLQARIDERNL